MLTPEVNYVDFKVEPINTTKISTIRREKPSITDESTNKISNSSKHIAEITKNIKIPNKRKKVSKNESNNVNRQLQKEIDIINIEAITDESTNTITNISKRKAEITKNIKIPIKIKKVNIDESDNINSQLQKEIEIINEEDNNNTTSKIIHHLQKIVIENVKTMKRMEMHLRTLNNTIDNISARQQMMFDKVVYEQ